MIVMKINATITLIAVVILFLTTPLIKQHGDLWDKVSDTAMGAAIGGVLWSLLALIWGV